MISEYFESLCKKYNMKFKVLYAILFLNAFFCRLWIISLLIFLFIDFTYLLDND